ncbi:MAG: SGNH/GDSL hydrolase family protein [Anaerolineales bacterium]|nr:SGNH/GDSL hydrolase family protein [Anaerolineales bacterium]
MKNRYWMLSLVIGWAVAVVAAGVWWMSTAMAAPAILVDHDAVDAAQIPQTWLDAARELDTFFAHKSVGNNILDGMADLQTQNPTRYTLDVAVAGADWFAGNSGILHQSLGTNGLPETKIDGFDTFIRGGYHAADVAMMKFCPGDTLPFGTMPAAEIWTRYRDMMAALEQAHPDVVFVWWTMPIAIGSDDRGNDEKEIFNGLMRDYCDANGCVLFDIADIESHDPNGNPVVSPAGYEAMWAGYASDGAHLNEVGRQRVAAAFWWLLARTAGWGDEPPPPPDPDFSLGITPQAADVLWHNTAVFQLSVQATGGFAEPVALSLSGLPAETAVSWQTNPALPGQTTTLTIGVDSSVPCADYAFTVLGSGGAITDSVTATLRVRQPLFLPLVVNGD